MKPVTWANCAYGGKRSVTAISKDHVAVTHCHNCGAAVDYHFCPVCGQSTKLHVPSASEFIHEFIGHYVAIEGRLWKTLALLLFKPGFLTWEYIQGRRVRYVEPLRIYLTFSILFFAVLKLAGTEMYQDEVAVPVPPAASRTGAAAPDIPVFGAAPAIPVKRGTIVTLTEGDGKRMTRSTPPLGDFDQGVNVAAGDYAPEAVARWKRFMARPLAERKAIFASAFYSYVPYALFCLMPLFALYLKLLYLGSGRRYGEHLLFALHANAFAFAVISLLILTNPLGLGLLKFALGCWLVFYLPTAMRRVYGGSRFVTSLRWIVLGLAHVISVFAAIMSTVGWAILR